MEIKVAKSAGFCFGVEKAVDTLDILLEENKKIKQPIYTFGEIIHNPHVVKKYEKLGVQIIHSLEELDVVEKGKILIRSHGVTRQTLFEIEEKGFEYVDATCPFVKRIHRIVDKAAGNGHNVLIFGNKDHPEIYGIAGWANTEVFIIKNMEELKSFGEDYKKNSNKILEVVAQTTFNIELYKKMVKKLHIYNFHVIINETVCNATIERQTEAKELSEQVTKMIVIGGRASSNTRKLFEICNSICKDTYLIESAEDLVLNVFGVNDIIGITAGASTPKNIIEEVISHVRNAKL